MKITTLDLQPSLENDIVVIQSLRESDFETLYKVASDPSIWEQHPNPDRYKKEVFKVFFKGAIESGGAFLVRDSKTGEAIGSSRFCEIDSEKKSLAIGYTFLAKDHWGTTYNRALKTLMIDYAFKYFEVVVFHIGAYNIRSQTAITKLGATKTGEIEMAYYGEANKLNFIYQIAKDEWERRLNS